MAQAIVSMQHPVGASGTGRLARKAVLGLTALVIVLLLAGVAWTSWHGYADAIDDAERSTANLAKVLDEHARRTLRLAEVTVEGLAERIGSDAEVRSLDLDQVTRIFEHRLRSARELLNIFLVGADGRTMVGASGPGRAIDLSDRPYFRFHRNSARDGVHVSEPVTSLAGKGRIVVVSHRLFNTDGSFGGIVSASISTDYFQDFYRSIDTGPNGVVTLRTQSGTTVARHPAREAVPGGSEADARVAQAVAAGQSFGTLDHTGRGDGIRRITSFRTIAGSPYIVSVGRAHMDFLAHWRSELWRYGIATSLLAAAAMAACWLLLRQMAGRETADAAKRAVERAAVETVRQSAAQESEARERLEMILDRMPLGCMVLDTNQRITYVNPSAERIFGVRFEDVKGLTPRETGVIAADESAAEARRESLRRGDSSGYTIVQTLTRNGRTIICEWTSTTLTGPDGSFAGILSLCHDITERSLAAEEVGRAQALEQATKQRLEMILNRMPLGCIVTDSEFRYTYWNPSAERIFGHRFTDVKGLRAADIGAVLGEPADVKARLARQARYSQGDADELVTMDNLTKDGRRIKCDWYTTPAVGTDGSFQGIVALFLDVTERSRAEEEVGRAQALEQAMRQRLEMILNRMPLGCLVTDSELRYTYWNPSAERILGHRFADVKGLRAVDIGTVLDEPADLEARQARYRLGDADDVLMTDNLTKDGRRIKCEWHTTPVTGADGSFQGVMALFLDVTERSSAEEALRQSQKMDALGQLTGGVAHDFNNLLTVIMANAELAEEEVEDLPEVKAALQAMLGAAIRGGELTGQLLAFSRRQTLEPKIVQLNALVEGMTRLLSRTIGENIETSLKTATDAWPVRIDPTQLETALTNLVVNARDAMPGGGRLVIETANAPLDEAYAARHPEVTAGDYVALSVSDTGTGMSAEVVDRVFEPFFTTKEVGKGTGLGMSMVFGFVKQSGGHIKIYSEVGIGTTIRLYLPRATPAADATADPVVAEAPAPAGSGEVILVVEDDRDVRESVVHSLLRLGYRISEAADGPQALEILGSGRRIDLLFTDMVMPGGMNGAELALRARESRPDLKILFTSGYTAPALANRMLQVDDAAILSKPYRIADLAREIRRILVQA